MEEHRAAFEQYGRDVSSGSRATSLNPSVFELKPDTFINLLQTILVDKDEHIKLGFLGSLNRLIQLNFSKYDKDVQNQIMSLILSYAKTITEDTEFLFVLSSIDSILKIVDKDWPELISLILTDQTRLNAHILASLEFVRNQDFVNQYGSQLIPILHGFLDSQIPNLPKTMLLLILSLCIQSQVPTLVEEGNDEQPITIDIEDSLYNSIWSVAIDIAGTDNYHSVFLAMQQLYSNVSNFKRQPAAPVRALSEVFSDTDSDLESRVTTIMPLLRLFPFLDDHTILDLIIPSSLDCLVEDYFGATIMFEHIEEADIELIDIELITAIWGILLTEINQKTNKRNAAIALFAPFADQIINVIEDSMNIIINAYIESLNAQSDNILSAYVSSKSLRSIIHRFDEPNQQLFDALLPYLTTDTDELLFYESNKAMRELLETGLYSTVDYEKKIMSLLPQYGDNRINYFTKLITSLLVDENGEPGLSIVEPIYDFALPFLSQDKSTIYQNALGVELFASLSQISTEYVEDEVQDCLEISAKILNSTESDCYPSAAFCLSVFAVQFEDQTKETMEKYNLLHRLLEIIHSKNGSNDIKIEPKPLSQVALHACSIAKAYDDRELASNLIDVCIQMLLNQEGIKRITKCGAQMLNELAKSLLPDDALKAFTIGVNLISISCSLNAIEGELKTPQKMSSLNDIEIIEDVIHALKKILKKYKVVPFDLADELMKRLFGENDGVYGLPKSIELIEDPDTTVFSFMKTFIRRFCLKSQTLKYVKMLIASIDIIDCQVLPSFLEPIETAIDLKMLGNDDLVMFLNHIAQMIDADDSDVTTSLLTVVTGIVRHYKDVVDINQWLTILGNLWDCVDETEEDHELTMAISMLGLELYSIIDQDNDCSLLLELLVILPLPAEICDLEHVIESTMKIVDNQFIHNKQEALVALVIFMAKVCLMKKKELEDYDLSSGIVADLRNKLKEVVKKNKQLENELKTEFSANEVQKLLK